jgi:hypothetical protein
MPPGGGTAYRVRARDILKYDLYNAIVTGQPNAGPFTVQSRALILYDDGTPDTIQFPDTATGSVASGSTFNKTVQGDHFVNKNGWIIGWTWNIPGTQPPVNSIWINAQIWDSASSFPTQHVAAGPVVGPSGVSLGQILDGVPDRWPIWEFQGTVGEDATVGTHVCTLTVSPAAGGFGSIDLLYGMITATGSAGLNEAVQILDGAGHAISTLFAASAAGSYSFPQTGAVAGATLLRLSGQMTLVLTSTTSTVSDTQTLSLACRIRPTGIPTAVLADNTGTPTLTVNTNAVV